MSKKSKSKKQRKRLNVELNEEAYKLLLELADKSGKNMAEVLRTGLALYGIAVEEGKLGRTLAIVKDDKVIKAIAIT